MTKHCSSCGIQLPDSAEYCDHCGAQSAKGESVSSSPVKGVEFETITRQKTAAKRPTTSRAIRFLSIFYLALGVLTLCGMFTFPMVWYNLTRVRDGTVDAYLGVFFGIDLILLGMELWRRNRKWAERLTLISIGILLGYLIIYYTVHIGNYYPAQYNPPWVYLAVILFQVICFWVVRHKLEVPLGTKGK